MTSIGVLVSTLNERYVNLNNLLQEERENVKYIICHQVTDGKNYDNIFSGRNDVAYYQIRDRGLSKSRNICISKADTDVCLIADDDIKYLPGAFDRIIQDFADLNADLICYKTMLPDSKPMRSYPIDRLEIRSLRSHRPCSIEIAFRRKSVASIAFDERFGLGAVFPMGEELIFINEAVVSGLKIVFVPEFIVIHPAETTATSRHVNKALVVATGAYYAKLYGCVLGSVLCARLALKMRKHYNSHTSVWQYFRLLMTGVTKFNRLQDA